jgi:hypothetical protein
VDWCSSHAVCLLLLTEAVVVVPSWNLLRRNEDCVRRTEVTMTSGSGTSKIQVRNVTSALSFVEHLVNYVVVLVIMSVWVTYLCGRAVK